MILRHKNARLTILLLCLVFILPSPSQQEEYYDNDDTKRDFNGARIAVIGGGMGGTATAFHLRELFGVNASITLFEKGALGGRLATVPIGDAVYEIGGTIIHPRNRYMKKFVKDFGLKERQVANGGTMGIYDGQEFVFQSSAWSFVTLLKLLRRYGLDLFRMNRAIDHVLDQFDRIYEQQEAGEAFPTIEDVMRAMGGEEFIGWLSTPVGTVLRKQGFSERFVGEMVAIAARANYGQNPDMMGFAGMVSLAGAMPGLWAVEGGNKRVPEELLKRSGADLVPSRVHSVRRVTGIVTKHQHFTLSWGDQGASVRGTGDFDVVVIATPLQDDQSGIKFIGFDGPISNLTGDYRHTVATLVRGWPRSPTFGKATLDDLPSQIMTNVDVPLRFRTLAKNFPVDYDPKSFNTSNQVYKVFSTEVLTQGQMEALFGVQSEEVQRDWLAYPYYQRRNSFPGFVLADGVFYPNAIEWAASAMEMAIIGARNSALLAHRYWTGAGSMEKDREAGIRNEL